MIHCNLNETLHRLQAYKDPMHAYDHGVAMHIITAVVRTIHKLEIDLGLNQNVLVKKLTARVYNLCSSLEAKHDTLLRFSHQSIVTLFETLTTPNKKGQKTSPIVDATDVQKLMLALPYLLDGLADEELKEFNSGKSARDQVSDPMPAAIIAINEWLQWYHLYRKEEPTESDVEQLTVMGRALLKTLNTTFPFTVRVGMKKLRKPDEAELVRSMWCNEKVHSILHAPRNLMQMGRSKNISCQVTETRHKGIKIKALKTNKKPGTMGLSVMNQEVRDSALQVMAMEMDKNGPCWRGRPEGHDSDSDSDSDLEDHDMSESQAAVLTAMRYFERNEDDKTKGCLADGLRCNLWARAHSVEHMEYTLVKGWTHEKGSRRGNLGLLMQDINWTPASRGSKPRFLDQQPCLAFLSNKVVHYLVDYHPEWLDTLKLPPTDGKHKQLETPHFQLVLQRLQSIPDVKKPFQLYSAIIIKHSLGGFQGGQTVHCCSFNISKYWEVI